MSNNIRTKDRFTENGWFKEEYLWELRQQIVLNSLFVADYRNSFGIDEKKSLRLLRWLHLISH